MPKFIITICLLSYNFFLFSQSSKQVLTEADYISWNVINRPLISHDGNWIVYEKNPNKGDGILCLYHTNSKKTYDYPRGVQAVFDVEHPYLVFKIQPEQQKMDSLKRIKVKKEDLPTDTLSILNLNTLQIVKIPDISSFSMPEKWGDWVFFSLEAERDSTLEVQRPRKADENEKIWIRRQLSTQKQDTSFYTTALAFAKEEPQLYIIDNSPDSTKLAQVFSINLISGNNQMIYSNPGEVIQLATSESGDKSAFLAHQDTTKSRIKPYALFVWENGMLEGKRIADMDDPFIQKEWIISEYKKPAFSQDGSKLFFGVAPFPILPDTTLLEDEIVEVEVWAYTDGRLHTQQKVMQERLKQTHYLCVYHTDKQTIKQIGDLSMPIVELGNEANADFAIGYDDTPYLKFLSWEGTTYRDVFLVNLSSGERQLIGKKIQGQPRWSPKAKFVYWYNAPDSAYFTFEVATAKIAKISGDHISLFYNELNDVPNHPRNYGIMGWSDEDQSLYIYDRYDIWKFDPTGTSNPMRITSGRGKKLVHRYIKLDPEARQIPKDIMLHLFDETGKEEGYAWLNLENGQKDMKLGGPYSLSRGPIKAQRAEKILFTQENYLQFPDLILSDLSFREQTRISEANPQQSNYAWGTIELVKWKNELGAEVEGLLAKPEGFDPGKKYPMIVNFYERSANTLHQHRTPFPHRSTINYTFYTSNGYLVFNPDVAYRTGYPGESALEAVVSGTKAMIDKGYVDENRIALQGHSWGGYQIAHIITKTDMFRCAESGAPVVNMISAYGGIRWGSGMSRMFQYERTQSRLGATLWEDPALYMENSPIFNIDKINTPVLILHNDHDGAVPWYQGIEFFVAMRRLNKPAWLLNYNGEPHWPVKWQNRMDFNKRIFQFFEYFLKDKPMPMWMHRGVPAIEKGINQGYEPAVKSDGPD